MNMRKKEYYKQKPGRKKRLNPTEIILFCCLPPILLCLLGILCLIEHSAPLTSAAAAYFGSMLEYPIASLAVVTVTAVLADIVRKRNT